MNVARLESQIEADDIYMTAPTHERVHHASSRTFEDIVSLLERMPVVN
jgi:hypothetical protein